MTMRVRPLLSVTVLTLAGCGQLDVGYSPDPGPQLALIHLEPATSDVPRGGRLQWEAVGVFSDGSTRSVTAEVAWSTGDSHVASVSNDPGRHGVVRGEREGDTEVRAALGGVDAQARVHVLPAAVLALAIQPDGVALPRGLPLQLKAVATLTDTTTQDVTDRALFTFGAGLQSAGGNGVVTGVSLGRQQVSALVDGVGAMATVVVTDATLSSVELDPDPVSLPLGAQVQLSVWGVFSDGTRADVTSSATFDSTQPSVAAFSPGHPGVLRGVAQGSATLSGTYAGFRSTGLVAVTQAALVAVEVSPNPVALAQQTQVKLAAVARYSDGSTLDVTAQADWSAEPASVASVSAAGVLTGLSSGQAQVQAGFSGLSGAAPVSVSAAQLASVDVSPAAASIPAGTTVSLRATGHFDDGTTQDVGFFALWQSEGPQVASVSLDATGAAVVLGHQVGAVAVTASLLGQSGAAQVTVTAAVMTSLEVSPVTADVPLGASAPLRAVGVYSDGSVADLTAQASWSSSSAAVTVSNAPATAGTVSAVSLGQATVSAAFGGFSASASVRAVPAQLLSITLVAAAFSTPLGVPVQLSATGVYTDGSRDLTTQVGWSSSNLMVASVSNAAGSRGRASPVGVGTAQVSAVLGGVSASQSFTVTPAQLVAVALSPGEVSRPKGVPAQLALLGTFTDATVVDLSAQASWTSDVPAVAAVSPAGLVSTLQVGSATVTAQVQTFSATCAVAVTPAELTQLAVTPSPVTAPSGVTRPLSATGTFTDGTTQVMTGLVTWASDDPSVVAVSNASGSQGLLTTMAPGSASVQASRGGVTSAPVPVTVTAVQLVSIEVEPSAGSTPLGFSRQLWALGHYDNGSTQPLPAVSWSSSDGSVATVSAAGLLSTVAQGTVTVSASLGGVTGSTPHTVSAPAVVAVTVQPGPVTLGVGGSTQLQAVVELSDGSAADVTALATWSSSDPSVSVSATGLVTGLGAGASTVSAAYGGHLGSVQVTVSP